MPFKQAIEPEVFEFLDYRRYKFSLGVKTEDGAWLSGQSASRYDPGRGRIVVDGDIREQARVAYSKMKTILAAAGLGVEHIVKMNDYVTAAGLDSYEQTTEVRRELFGTRFPAVTPVVVNRLLRPDALIEIEAVASSRPAQVHEFGYPVGGVPRAAAVRVGSLVYVSGQMAVEGDGTIRDKGDLVAQTRRVYENLSAALQQAGVTTRQIVKTVDYLHTFAREEYKHTGQVRREYLAEPYPAATGIVVSRLPHPDALIEVDAFAYDGEREVVNPGWTRYEKLTYSPAIKAGDYLFLAGQFSINPVSLEFEYLGDLVGQTRNVYLNLLKVMEAAGLSASAMLKTVEYVVESALDSYRASAKVREELFSRPYPSATGAVIHELLRPGMLIEIDSVARVR